VTLVGNQAFEPGPKEQLFATIPRSGRDGRGAAGGGRRVALRPRHVPLRAAAGLGAAAQRLGAPGGRKAPVLRRGPAGRLVSSLMGSMLFVPVVSAHGLVLIAGLCSVMLQVRCWWLWFGFTIARILSAQPCRRSNPCRSLPTCVCCNS